MLPDIQLLPLLTGILSSAKIAQLTDILYCFMCAQYGITVRGLSRYSTYSLRSWFRFLKQTYPWVQIRAILFKHYIYQLGRGYLISIDEVVEGKSRNKTYGIDRFWSGVQKRPVMGICIFVLSLIDISSRRSYTLAAEQVVFSEADKARIARQKQKVQEGKKRTASGNRLASGRKAGTKNKPEAEPDNASFRAFMCLLKVVMATLNSIIPNMIIPYMVADGKYASKHYITAIRQATLHLITRLPVNAALRLPYTPASGARKTRRKYAQKVDLHDLDQNWLKETRTEGDCRIQIYELSCYNPKIYAQLLRVVIVKTDNIKTKKAKFALFACTHPNLDWQTLLDYYSLRFQIEFDFRDAKQFFGLSDFKNYCPQNVTNFINLCFLATLVARILQQLHRQKHNNPYYSIADLKTLFHARFIVKNAIKLLQKSPESIFLHNFADEFLPPNLIHAA